MRGQSSQMWLSNFPAADGFDLAQATVSHDGSSWTYNLEGGVFKRSGNGNFGTTPVVVGAGVTKEQLLLREDFMVSDTRHSTVICLMRIGRTGVWVTDGASRPCSRRPPNQSL
jgi:hypothetical protein